MTVATAPVADLTLDLFGTPDAADDRIQREFEASSLTLRGDSGRGLGGAVRLLATRTATNSGNAPIGGDLLQKRGNDFAHAGA